VVATAHVERRLEDLEDREMTSFGIGNEEPVPGAQAVGADVALRDLILERLEELAEPASEGRGSGLAQV
jgi:hypothetical protein